jgi:HEPN domain-containing protein
MSKIFMSYRRQDSADVTGRLHDRLETHFGQGAVFIDIDAIPLGLDFRKHLGDAVNQCDVLLAVIGDHWLDARYENGHNKGQRRLDDPHDFVRIEIESALARGIPVVPLLVGRNAMPAVADLPDGLKELAYRNAAEVRSGPDFRGQVDRLIRGLEQLVAKKRELREGVQKAIHIANEDPQMALGRARMVLELMVRDVYERRFQEPPGTRSLENLIERLDQKGFLPGRLDVDMLLRCLSAADTSRWGVTVNAGDVHQAITQLTDLLGWYMEVEQADALGQQPAGIERPEPDRVKPAHQRPEIAVVPKGLRSFDADDSDFFLQLLPGARDKDGLPESLRFWKHRVEAVDEIAFTVGVIYGPSGCGKSSLMKAGLLPRLSKRITSVYLEATLAETETKLLSLLRKRVPGLSADLDLAGAIAALRPTRQARPDHNKLLIVIDQFEQWLHANRREQDTELARALRQCDGEHVQCIVMVRDDFWVALNRFMDDLRIEVLQGRNAALVDLFDLIHARLVLAAFGRAYGRLPGDAGAVTKDQEQFLTQAIEGLEQDGRVIPIRLALFAEMVKGRPWTPATLKGLGGTAGVGFAFLEEKFGATALKTHQQAAQRVLKALLPESGTNIKGHMRSHEELAAAAGYESRPRELDNLLRTLDHDVRLITPTDPEGKNEDGRPENEVQVSVTDASDSSLPLPSSVLSPHSTVFRYYQLTHDYLVPSIREWLTRKQRETRKGRAELRLAERSALWNAKPENRHLPSVLEWANIRLLTGRNDWTEPQRKMMKRAGRFHGLRGLGLAAIVTGLVVLGLNIRRQIVESNQATVASGLVQQLVKADTAQVPGILESLETYRRWTDPELRRVVAQAPGDPQAKLHASLALLPVDAAQAGYLHDRLLMASPVELPVIWGILRKHDHGIENRLWQLLGDPKSDPEQSFRAACALANTDSSQVEKSWDTVSPFVTDRFLTAVSRNPGDYAALIETLRPLRRQLLPPLASIFRDIARSESDRNFATTILADYAADDPERLADLLMTAGAKAYVTLFPVAERQAEKTVPVFQAELAKKATFDWRDPPLDETWTEPDPAVVSRIESAEGLLAERFAFCQTIPIEDFVRTAEILRTSGYRPVRFRPFADGQAVKVAAVWTRDGRKWRIESGVTAEQVQKQDDELRRGVVAEADGSATDGAGRGSPDPARDSAGRGSPDYCSQHLAFL